MDNQLFRNEVLHVPVLALLLFVPCRMFSHHVSLEMVGPVGLVVAVFTGKRLLASVRSYVPL